MTVDIADALHILGRSQPLTEAQTEGVFERILTGQVSEEQLTALLTLLRDSAVTTDELVGAARVMRRHVTPIPYTPPPGVHLIDTCGTGGAPKTFNISTIAALVVAAAGEGKIKVAKHGNRSRSGRGSAELLGALGVNVDAPPEVQARCLDRAGVCFCFAIHHHPAAKHAAGVRKALGFPTIFNLLGPLTNPARAPRQLLGVFDGAAVEKMTAALARLGAERAMVVHGRDGMDEITTTTTSIAGRVEGGRASLEEIDPASVGIARASRHELEAATLEDAVRICREVLDGEKGPRREIVVLNAGAALVIGGVAGGLREGMTKAESAIDSGEARSTLARLSTESRTA